MTNRTLSVTAGPGSPPPGRGPPGSRRSSVPVPQPHSYSVAGGLTRRPPQLLQERLCAPSPPLCPALLAARPNARSPTWSRSSAARRGLPVPPPLTEPLVKLCLVFLFHPRLETLSVTDSPDVLDRQKCLAALASLRHAKWFQVCILFFSLSLSSKCVNLKPSRGSRFGLTPAAVPHSAPVGGTAANEALVNEPEVTKEAP